MSSSSRPTTPSAPPTCRRPAGAKKDRRPCKSAPVAEVPDARRRRWQRRPGGSRYGNYKHGRYTAEMVATRRWLRETTRMLLGLKEFTGLP